MFHDESMHSDKIHCTEKLVKNQQMNVTGGLNQINSTDEEDGQEGCEDNHMKLDDSEEEDDDEAFSQNGSSLSK